MARRRNTDRDQPDLFSILDGEGSGEQSGDTSDRSGRVQPAPGAATGMDTGRSRRRSSRTRQPGSASRSRSWPTRWAPNRWPSGRSGHGEHPDYLTKVGLLNTAMASAKEIVLSEQLYELIPEPQDPPNETTATPPSLDRSQVPWDQRWTRTQYRSDPSEQIEDLVAQIWPDPDFSAVFRIKAGLPPGGPRGGSPGTAGPSRGPAGRRTGSAGVQRPAPRRPARAVTPQASLFDEPADQPTDPRSIDPGGQPLPPPVQTTPEITAAPTPPAPTADLPQRGRGGAAAGAGGISHRHRLSCQHPHTGALGAKARVRANIAAIELLDALRDGRPSRHRRRAGRARRVVRLGRGTRGIRSAQRHLHRRAPTAARPADRGAVPAGRSLRPQCALHRPRSGRRHLAGLCATPDSPEAGFSNRVAAAAHSSGMRPTMRS